MSGETCVSEGDSFESDEDVDDEITSGVALGESAVESLIEMSERLEISGVDGTSEELPSLEELLVVAEDDSWWLPSVKVWMEHEQRERTNNVPANK